MNKEDKEKLLLTWLVKPASPGWWWCCHPIDGIYPAYIFTTKGKIRLAIWAGESSSWELSNSHLKDCKWQKAIVPEPPKES